MVGEDIKMIDKEFNMHLLEKIEKLLSKNRDCYQVDLHLHTNYSADGIQTVEQAIDKAREYKFDIISITDHDSIGVYEKIIGSELCKRDSCPIILPGVEFTVSYPEYEGRCHVLKYFFDVNDQRFRQNLLQNQKAFQYRTEIWFQRIKENRVLQYFIKRYDIVCSKTGYLAFFNGSKTNIPDYPTLMEYLYSLLSPKGIDIWDVYEKAVKENSTDSCDLRRNKKSVALQRFWQKYKDQDIAHNYRKLRPILAPLGIDDNDYPGYESSGSLSVNEFGQVSIWDINNSGLNILAHPEQSKLKCVDSLTDVLHGLELNCHSDQALNEAVLEKACNMSLCVSRGSDKHKNTDEFYENVEFYYMTRLELESFASCAKELVNNR